MTSIMKWKSKYLKKGIAILFFLAVWQFAYWKVENEILLASPLQVLETLWENIRQDSFWQIVFQTFRRIAMGFLLAFFTGCFLGGISFRLETVRIALEPFLHVLKSIPVASFVVLILIWSGSESLGVWISFLVVLPGIYESTLAGLKAADLKLIEAANVYRVSAYHQWFYIYRLSLLPYLKNASGVTIGMAWKSGVAAELIGTPLGSVGEQLYLSKITLDTASVLAWTLVIICLSNLFETIWILLLSVWEKQTRPWFPCRKRKTMHYGRERISLEHIRKSYGEQTVLQDCCFTLDPGSVTALMGESGIGKTTILRMISGLEKPDEGNIRPGQLCCSYVFQEDRLCSQVSAVENCRFFTGKDKEIRKELEQLLPSDKLDCPVSQLSGGMRRRVSIAAALLRDSDVILMDEPFNGLDEENKKNVAMYIKNKQNGRICLFTTHSLEEVKLMNAECIKPLTK